jgi:hypothetical protein
MKTIYSNLTKDEVLIMFNFVLAKAISALVTLNSIRTTEVIDSTKSDSAKNMIDSLTSLSDLHTQGLLTEDEYTSAKRRLLIQ